jgi:hypothetical protein
MKSVSRPFLRQYVFLRSDMRLSTTLRRGAPFSCPPGTPNNKVSLRKSKPGRGQLEINGMLGGASKLVCSHDHGPAVVGQADTQSDL